MANRKRRGFRVGGRMRSARRRSRRRNYSRRRSGGIGVQIGYRL